jgi:hypothetical protein
LITVRVNQPVIGTAASGAAKSGNPVQVGAVFNTTQPTVTNGQVVEGQASNRGGLIVTTGVDTFHVTVDAVPSTTVTGTLTVQQSTAANLKVDLSGTGANATAIKVDGSAVTQPVSGTITATPASPLSPKTTQVSTSVAAGGTSGTNLRSAAITSAKTGKLARAVCSSSVAIRADLQTVVGGVATLVETQYSLSGTTIKFDVPLGYVFQPAGAAFTGFQITATNLDPTSSADIASSFYWDEQ